MSSIHINQNVYFRFPEEMILDEDVGYDCACVSAGSLWDIQRVNRRKIHGYKLGKDLGMGLEYDGHGDCSNELRMKLVGDIVARVYMCDTIYTSIVLHEP